MTLGGIVFMALSWTFILSLIVFTYRRLLGKNPPVDPNSK